MRLLVGFSNDVSDEGSAGFLGQKETRSSFLRLKPLPANNAFKISLNQGRLT